MRSLPDLSFYKYERRSDKFFKLMKNWVDAWRNANDANGTELLTTLEFSLNSFH